jgi:hypothetical protein
MKAYEGVDVQIHVSLPLALVEDESSATRPVRFTLGARHPGTYWIGSWVGPRIGFDDVERRIF